MSANLTNPFGESCCDGGECGVNSNSARSCGCDPGAGWVCQVHQPREYVAHVPIGPPIELIYNNPTRLGVVTMAAEYTNPLEEHLHEVVNPCWNYAGRITTYEEHLQNAVLGLVGEVGEVADLVKKMLYHTAGVDFTAKMKHELGDAAFYFAKTLEVLGLSLEEVLAANKEKLQSRHPELGKVDTRFAPGYIGG